MSEYVGVPTIEEVLPARQSWKWVLFLFCLISVIEAYGVSQVQAFLPRYLQVLGVAPPDVPQWTGIITSSFFLFGLPLVPLWGIWADKYSRKGVIIRSALVEAVVFTFVGFSQSPYQLAASVALAGFQLGNTGVMLGALRDIVPLKRLGLVISTFGAMGPIGFAIGPVVGGVLLDGLHISYNQMYFVAAAVSLLAGAALLFGFKEVRPSVIPEGSVLKLALGVIGTVLRVASTRRVFAIFGLSFLAYQMVFPYLALVVQAIYGQGSGLDSAIGWVTGGASLLGAIISPAGGVLGDRFGFRTVLAVSAVGGAVTLTFMPFAGSVILLVAAAVLLGAFFSAFIAMVFSLLAVETPEEQRSSTLNLVYLPIYLGGIIGPQIGGLIVRMTNHEAHPTNFVPVFLIAALFFVAGLAPLLGGRNRRG